VDAKREYKRLRQLGWPARDAWRSAKVAERFAQLEDAGLVRLRTDVDLDPATVLDFDGTPRERQAVAKRADAVGVWGLVAEARCPHCESWHVVDSCWGFVGEDYLDSGYDSDLMRAAIDAVDDGTRRAA